MKKKVSKSKLKCFDNSCGNYGNKKLNAQLKNFNAKLKKYLDKKYISRDTYSTLLFNKEKISYYNSSIFNKKQLTEFIKELKSLNRKSIQLSKKYTDMTKFEIDIYNKRKKYFENYANIYGINYNDIKFGVKKLGREKYFSKVLATKFVIQDRVIRYRLATKQAYKNVFGEDNPLIDTLSDYQLDILSANPNFSIKDWYATFNKEERKRFKANIDRLIDKALKLKRPKKLPKKFEEKRLLSLFDAPEEPTYYADDIFDIE